MDAIDIIKALLAHMQWADATVWRAVMGNEASRSDNQLRDRLYHLHLVQHAFLTVWRGVALVPRAADSFDAPSLLQFAHDYHAELAHSSRHSTPRG